METAGFYKLLDNNLYYAPNKVHSPHYTLEKSVDLVAGLEIIDGWFYFNSETEAKLHFNLGLETDDE